MVSAEENWGREKKRHGLNASMIFKSRDSSVSERFFLIASVLKNSGGFVGQLVYHFNVLETLCRTLSVVFVSYKFYAVEKKVQQRVC